MEKTSTMDDLYRIENALMAGQVPQDFSQVTGQVESLPISMELDNNSYESFVATSNCKHDHNYDYFNFNFSLIYVPQSA